MHGANIDYDDLKCECNISVPENNEIIKNYNPFVFIEVIKSAIYDLLYCVYFDIDDKSMLKNSLIINSTIRNGDIWTNKDKTYLYLGLMLNLNTLKLNTLSFV